MIYDIQDVICNKYYVINTVIMKRGARWTGQILISMFHLLHIVHIVHGFSKSIVFTSNVCGKVHQFSRKLNGKSIQEREKTAKHEKNAKSDQKVA